MSTEAFGNYANESGLKLEAGMYGAMVGSVELVRDEDGQPHLNDYEKHQVDVQFVIDADTKPKRRFTISFGKNNQTGQYSAFAKFLEAASGVPCGDKHQRNLLAGDLEGKQVRIVVEENDRGYMDVTSVLPPAKAGSKKKDSTPAFVSDETDDEIPF